MAFDDAVKGDDPLERGRARIDWIRSRMPLLAATRAEFSDTRPFHGHRIGMALHLEPKTAVLLETLAAGGAELVVTGNHGSTQDDIAAVLRADGMTVFGSRGDTLEQHHDNVEAVLDQLPDLLLDNGGDLAAGSILRGADSRVIGGTEETTSGGDRLRGVLAGRVPFPVIVINDSRLKAVGENTHAVGQSIVESFMRLTNLMIPGRRFVVVGYGYCGRGIARYLKAFGAQVAVVEVDEIAAFEAAMDGYRVAPLVDVAGWADAIITATGRPEVVGPDIFPLLRDGAILANSGHFSWEIDVPALRRAATSIRMLDDSIERMELADGRRIVLLAGGRMLNLAGRDPRGNSLESMDMGFLLQALSLERLVKDTELPAGAQPVPDDIDRVIARRMVAAMSSDR